MPTYTERALKILGYAMLAITISIFINFTFFKPETTQHSKQAFEVCSMQMCDMKMPARKILASEDKKIPYFEDTEGNCIISSEFFSPEIKGYADAINIAVKLKKDGTVLYARVYKHSETPDYYQRAENIITKTFGININKDNKPADIVTGATYTSRAIIDSIYLSAWRFTDLLANRQSSASIQSQPGNPATIIFIAALLFLPLLRIYIHNKWFHGIWLAGVMLYFGIINNFQFSLESVRNLIKFNIPDFSPSQILVIGVPLSIILLGNYYCGWLCPFGALQELAGRIIPQKLRINPDKRLWRIIRFFKFFLLFAIALAVITDFYPDLVYADPLPAFFSVSSENHYLLIILAALLILSLFIERFWCRTLCLSGAFLSLIGRIELLKRIIPTKIWYKLYPLKPGLCNLGVVSFKDGDCINCDYCTTGKPAAEEPLTTTKKSITIISIFSLIIYAYIIFSFVQDKAL